MSILLVVLKSVYVIGSILRYWGWEYFLLSIVYNGDIKYVILLFQINFMEYFKCSIVRDFCINGVILEVVLRQEFSDEEEDNDDENDD